MIRGLRHRLRGVHRVHRLRRDEFGLSMTELLVASALTLVMLVMVVTMFVQVTRITTASNQTHNSNSEASNVANEVTAVLRVATTLAKVNVTTPDPAIVAGSRDSVTIYSLSNTSATNPAPVRVTFTLDTSTGRVTETRCGGTASGSYWTFGSCSSTSTRILGSGVLPATGVADQFFTYRNANGTAITIGAGTLSDTERGQVTSITVTVRVQAPGSATEPVLFSNTVVLRNLGLDSGT